MPFGTRQQRRALKRNNRRHGDGLEEVTPDQWPARPPDLLRVWRSSAYLVQAYRESDDGRCVRLSINRTEPDSAGWADGISWDALQRIKAEIGYGDRWAIECYPPEADTVNVANMRHLWILPAPPPVGWRRRADAGEGAP